MLLVTAQHSRPCFPQKSLCTTKRWAFWDVRLFLKRVWVVYASNGAVARTAALQSTVTCGRTEVCCVCERWPCTQAGRSTDVRWPRANAGRGRGQGGSHRCVVQRHRKPAACASTPTPTHPDSEPTHTRTHATTALPWPVACGAAPADSADAVSTTQHDHDHDRDHDTRASQLGPQQHDDGVCTPRLTTTQATSKPDTVIRSNTLSPPQAITGRADV